MTTLTEPYVQRAIYTIEDIGVQQMQSTYASKPVLIHCTATDASFNYGQSVKVDNAGVKTHDTIGSQAIGYITVESTPSGFHSQDKMSFIGSWPISTIAFQVTDPFDVSDIVNASGEGGSMVVSMRVDVIEPLTNVTNEVVQTADYSGIKRARVAPQPPV